MGCKQTKPSVINCTSKTGMFLVYCKELEPLEPETEPEPRAPEKPKERTFIGFGGQKMVIPPGFGRDMPIFAGLEPTRKPHKKKPDPRPMEMIIVYKVQKSKININPFVSDDDDYVIKEKKVTVLENDSTAKAILSAFRRKV